MRRSSGDSLNMVGVFGLIGLFWVLHERTADAYRKALEAQKRANDALRGDDIETTPPFVPDLSQPYDQDDRV